MKNILLLGLQTDTNLGDTLIGECTEWLVRKACAEMGAEDVQVVSQDMRGCDYRELLRAESAQRAAEAERRTREAERVRNSPKRRVLRALSRCVPVVIKDALSPNREQRREQEREAKAAERAQQAEERRVRRIVEAGERAARCAAESIDGDTAAVIFVGGGLIKYGHQQHLPQLMAPYVRRANELGVPVMFNAVGVEGCDAADAECAELIELLKLPCVRCVTVRDDIALMRSGYIHSETHTAKVADPACWAAEIFPRDRKPTGVIGLGMVRGRLFEDHGVPMDEEALLTLWTEVVAELERRGLRWRLFANGLRSDWLFGQTLLERLGRAAQTDELLLHAPETTAQLIDIINGFDGVIAGRLHTAITAFAYGVPAVEPVWNVKQRMFGEDAGVPERFVEQKELSGAVLVERLILAIAQGCAPSQTLDRNATYVELREFLRGCLL